jgi:hypothetical protein
VVCWPELCGGFHIYGKYNHHRYDMDWYYHYYNHQTRVLLYDAEGLMLLFRSGSHLNKSGV